MIARSDSTKPDHMEAWQLQAFYQLMRDIVAFKQDEGLLEKHPDSNSTLEVDKLISFVCPHAQRLVTYRIYGFKVEKDGAIGIYIDHKNYKSPVFTEGKDQLDITIINSHATMN